MKTDSLYSMKKFSAIFIGISFSLLCWAQTQQIESKILLKTQTSWDGVALPAQNLTSPEITVVHIVVQPKAELKIHKHSVINVGYIIKGALKIKTLDGKMFEVKQGESVAETIGQWHWGANEGDEPAELIVMYFGQKGYERAIAKDNL